MPNEILLIKSPFSWCDRDCRRGAIWSLLHKPFWRGTGKGGREGGEERKEGRENLPCCKQASGSFQQGLELQGGCHHPPSLSLLFSGNAGTHQSLSSLRASPPLYASSVAPVASTITLLKSFPDPQSFFGISRHCSQQLWLWVVAVVMQERSPGLHC